MCSLRGEILTRDSEAKLQGRRLPNVQSSLRSLRRPCSGRTGPVPYFYVVRLAKATVCGSSEGEGVRDRRLRLEGRHLLLSLH